MSMEFSDNQSIGGGGGFTSGLLAGSALNRRDDGYGQGQWIWAIIVFIIFVVIALVFLAFMRKDEKRDGIGGGGIGEIVAAAIASKGIGGNCDHEHTEIKDMISHLEDRRVSADIQKEVYAGEMANLKEFGEIKATLGMQSQALAQVLQIQNNDAIINGVINKLRCCA